MYVADVFLFGPPNPLFDVSVINGSSGAVINNVIVGYPGAGQFSCAAAGTACPGFGVAANPATNTIYVANKGDSTYSVVSPRPGIRTACLIGGPNCLVLSSKGTLFPNTPQSVAVNLVAVSLRSSETNVGTQAVITIFCDYSTNVSQQCSAFYVDGNVWSPAQTDLTKSPFIIQNGEPYFYLQFHWWDFQNSRITTWGTWWYGATPPSPNWFWGVYWTWRTYVNYYIGIPYIPWWWWTWHWMYWRYWGFWGTAFST